MCADILTLVMHHAGSVRELHKCKSVCHAWCQSARRTLCDIEWIMAKTLSLHDVLRFGDPSPELTLAMASAMPSYLSERNLRGLLPLQYACEKRKEAALIDALRKVTVVHVPGGLPRPPPWAKHSASRNLALRQVRTRISQAPIRIAAV